MSVCANCQLDNSPVAKWCNRCGYWMSDGLEDRCDAIYVRALGDAGKGCLPVTRAECDHFQSLPAGKPRKKYAAQLVAKYRGEASPV